MLGKDDKQRIVQSLFRAFDNYATQHYRSIFDETSRLAKDVNSAVIEDKFLQWRALNINSYIHVLDKRSKNKSLAKHRMLLIRVAILSIAKGGLRMSDIDHYTDGDNPDGIRRKSYTERQIRRIVRDTYKDVFCERKQGRKSGDQRVKPVSSVFSVLDPLPPGDVSDFTRAYMTVARDYSWFGSSTNTQMRLFQNSVIRQSFPQYLDDLMKFRDECRIVFESLGERDERIDFLRECIVDDAKLLDVFYSHMTSIMDMVWFRTKSKEEQDSLIQSSPEVKYGQDDAKKARRILVGIYGQDVTRRLLDISGSAFLQYGQPAAAVHVFRECVDMSKTDMDSGVAWQNVAASHRLNKNFKLALSAMKKALLFFEAAGNVHKICNALQLIGESQWRLGFKDAAMGTFGDVETRSMDMDEESRWKGHFFLGMSFGRLGDMSMRQKHLVKALEMIPLEKTEDILRMNELIDNERPIYSDAAPPQGLRQECEATMHALYKALYENTGPAFSFLQNDTDNSSRTQESKDDG